MSTSHICLLCSTKCKQVKQRLVLHSVGAGLLQLASPTVHHSLCQTEDMYKVSLRSAHVCKA